MFLQYAMKKFVRGTTEIWSFTWESFRLFLEDNGLRMAASLAFYTTFSITPALLIGLSVAGVVIGNTRAESELAAGVGTRDQPGSSRVRFQPGGAFQCGT